MTFRHRYWHLALWTVIAPVIGVGLALAIAIRPTAKPDRTFNKLPAVEAKP
jgi:hypothetical protein